MNMHDLPRKDAFVTYPAVIKKLPVVLTPRQVNELLAAFATLMYEVSFTSIHGAGLRISEA